MSAFALECLIDVLEAADAHDAWVASPATAMQLLASVR